MTFKSLSKVLVFSLAFLLLATIYFNLWFEKSSTLSMISKDGYKDLHEGELIILTKQNTKLRLGAWSIPGNMEEKLSLQVTFPRFFEKGLRRFQITAENNDLIFSEITTKTLRMKDD